MSQKLNIGLLGGSFDPPHVVHALLADYVRMTEEVDEVWVIPAFSHPFGKVLTSFDHRFEMVTRAFAHLPWVRVSRVEQTLGGVSYTWRTLEYLVAQHPSYTFRLIVGADVLAHTQQWERFDQVEKMAPLIVVGRDGYDAGGAPRKSAVVTPGPFTFPALSAELIRGSIRAGDDVSRWVARSVLDYIREHALYETT